MMRTLATAAFGVVGLGLICAPAEAVPAFQRRYQVNCSLCHAGFPKLNNVGQQFKARGFRLESETEFESNAWLRSLPVSLRTTASHEFIEDAESVSEGLGRVVSAGNLGRRLSFWADDGIRFWSSVEDAAPQHVKPNDAYLRYELSRPGRLYVRAGRMEMDLPFTQARSSHLFDYDVYDAFGSDSLGQNKDGVEMGGVIKRDARWSFGAFAGKNPDTSNDFSVFLRMVIPYGLHRFGVLGHFGSEAPGGVSFQRYGLDFDLWWQHLNVSGVYAVGRYGDAPTVHGAFVQSDYHLEEKVAIGARLSLVDAPKQAATPESGASAQLPESQRETRVGFYPGVQVWVMTRVRLSFEYGFFNGGRKSRGRLQAELVL